MTEHLWAYFKLPATGFRNKQTEKTTSPRMDSWTKGQRQMRDMETKRDRGRPRARERERER